MSSPIPLQPDNACIEIHVQRWLMTSIKIRVHWRPVNEEIQLTEEIHNVMCLFGGLYYCTSIQHVGYLIPNVSDMNSISL